MKVNAKTSVWSTVGVNRGCQKLVLTAENEREVAFLSAIHRLMFGGGELRLSHEDGLLAVVSESSG